MGIINAECGKTFRIAYQGENKRQQVRFDLADIMGEFPGGTAVLAVLRNGDADPVPAAETAMDGTALIWTVTAWECALEGFLYAQVTYAAGETVAKTKVYRFDVKNSLVVNGAEPEDWQDLVGQLVTAADGVNSAISAAMDTLAEKVAAAEAAQDAAEDAQEAAETARDEAVAAVGQYDDMTAEATGLAAGEEPTAVIDHTGDHPVLQLGIPKGEKGDTGATGQAGLAGPSGVDGFSPTAGVSKVGKIATITIVISIFMMSLPERGYQLAALIISVSFTISGLRTLIYYFTMSRFMVGGKRILFRGLILLDLGLFTSTFVDRSKIYLISLLNTMLALVMYPNIRTCSVILPFFQIQILLFQAILLHNH